MITNSNIITITNKKYVLQATGNNVPSNNKASTTLAPEKPTQTETNPSELPSLEQVLAELKELRMEMELFKTRHE